METCLFRKHQGTAWLCTMGRWGWEGEEELSGPVPCLCYLVLSALPRFIEASYTQVLKEGLGPKSELKPMGVTFVCQSLTVCLFP